MRASKRVIKNTGILYIRMAITVFISLYSTRLVLAALGTEDYGIFNVVGGSIAMFSFLNAAMASATQRFMSYAQGEGNFHKLRNIFNVSVVLHLVIGLSLIIILEIAGYYLFNGILKIPSERIFIAKIIYQFMLLSFFVTVITVPYDAVVNAHEDMLYVAIIGIIEALLKLIIAIVILYSLKDKLIIYGILMSLLSITILICMRIYCHRRYKEVKIDIKKYYDKKIFREMGTFAAWNFLSSAAGIISMQGMTILLNSFFGVIVNAAQGVATQISGQLMAFSNTMLKALNPIIVKSEGGNNREQMLRASMTGNKLSYFLFSFFSIPVIIEMPFILSIWLKNVPEFAIMFCRLNLFRLSLSQLTVTFPTALAATGNIRKSSQAEAIIYILLIPFSYALFKLGFSPVSIYINLIFMVIALFIARIYFVNKLCNMPVLVFFKNVVLRCLCVSIFTFGFAYVPYLIINESFYRLFFILFISFGTFIPLLYYVGLESTEKKMLTTLLSKFLNKFGILKL